MYYFFIWIHSPTVQIIHITNRYIRTDNIQIKKIFIHYIIKPFLVMTSPVNRNRASHQSTVPHLQTLWNHLLMFSFKDIMYNTQNITADYVSATFWRRNKEKSLKIKKLWYMMNRMLLMLTPNSQFFTQVMLLFVLQSSLGIECMCWNIKEGVQFRDLRISSLFFCRRCGSSVFSRLKHSVVVWITLDKSVWREGTPYTLCMEFISGRQ